MTRRIAIWCLVIAGVILQAHFVCAAPQAFVTVDSSFKFSTAGLEVKDWSTNNKEWVKGPSLSTVDCIATQSDGKVVVVTQDASDNNISWVLRVNKDGSQDASFAMDWYGMRCVAIAVSPTGDIVLGAVKADGTTPAQGYLLKISNDGAQYAYYPLPTPINAYKYAIPYALQFQGDGKLVVGLSVTLVNYDVMRVLVRYHQDALDLTFGDGGIVKEPVSMAGIYAVLPGSDGGIFVGSAGYHDGGSQPSFVVEGYLATGQLNPKFGSNGVVIEPFSETPGDIFAALGLGQNANAIFAAGVKQTKQNTCLAIASYSPSGQLLSNTDALCDAKLFSPEGSLPSASLFTLPSGEMIVMAYGGPNSNPDAINFVVLRVDAKGSIVDQFSGKGSYATAYTGPNADTFVLAGTTSDKSVSLTRYIVTLPLPPEPEKSEKPADNVPAPIRANNAQSGTGIDIKPAPQPAAGASGGCSLIR